MEYVRSRGLMEGGHRYMVDGHTVWQVQLVDGRWVNVYPQKRTDKGDYPMAVTLSEKFESGNIADTV